MFTTGGGGFFMFTTGGGGFVMFTTGSGGFVMFTTDDGVTIAGLINGGDFSNEPDLLNPCGPFVSSWPVEGGGPRGARITS